MAYATVEKLAQSLQQVADFNKGAKNDFQIVTQEKEKRREYQNVNHGEMNDYLKLMRMREEDFQPSYDSYDIESLQYSPNGPNTYQGFGRGKLIREAARQSADYNKQFRKDIKVKQQMMEAGIMNNYHNGDLREFFNQRFKMKNNKRAGSVGDSPESEDKSSEELEGEDDDDEEERNKNINISSLSLSDANSIGSEGDGSKRTNRYLKKPVKTSVYVPPHRRTEDNKLGQVRINEKIIEKNKVVEMNEGDGTFGDIAKRAECKELTSPYKGVKQKTASEWLASPGWDVSEKPPEQKAPKCRNAILSQFLPKCTTDSEKKPPVIPAGYEERRCSSSAAGSSETSSSADKSSNRSTSVSPISWIPSDRTPTANRMFMNFDPAKARNFTLADFIVPAKSSTKKKK